MRDTKTGRFQPGQSGNPGGRPAAEPLVKALHGRRAQRSLLDLVRVLGPGLTVLIVDARGLQIGPKRGSITEFLAAVHDLADFLPRPEADAEASPASAEPPRRVIVDPLRPGVVVEPPEPPEPPPPLPPPEPPPLPPEPLPEPLPPSPPQQQPPQPSRHADLAALRGLFAR